ncbi:hypothetical protein LMG23994_02018 [Cupriavidus pinatubonensis]|uniref:Phage integrase n=1 Tax=Cupriavidus pinatubonensis TaxID=248026 RepID=A0ABN7YFA8_9BURK|nr:hypothetical protein LMG23994_02018 [Cupriavidus pinatubonensis]
MRNASSGLAETQYHQLLEGRFYLANIRIEAEISMFIAQTGMNSSQALNEELQKFFYISHLDGYEVKDHKNRRRGMVLFQIFKDYKAHFERYLEWRRKLFPDSGKLFPLIGREGTRQERRFNGARIKLICQELGIPYVPPRTLRNTRINWLLRKSADPELTADLAQHTTETLLTVYALPSLQRAMVETVCFWSKADPHLVRTESVAPGDCTGTPKPVEDMPDEAPKPDCIKAAGCLWCQNHRDVDSFDHIWALASFKHLKAIELSKARTPITDKSVPPSQSAIDRINDKLRWYEQSNETRRDWVSEAQARIEEGDWHPNFAYDILELEGEA